MNTLPTLTVVVFGASGDLAKKKTYPSLLSLYASSSLPSSLQIVGFSRTVHSAASFRSSLRPSLTSACPLVPSSTLDSFLSICTYVSCPTYGDLPSHRLLSSLLSSFSSSRGGPCSPDWRLFYLAVPSDVFATIAAALHSSGSCSPLAPTPPSSSSPTVCLGSWSRLVLEKPFGRDLSSARSLNDGLRSAFPEAALHRIDHYLGKASVKALLALRFGNPRFAGLWSRRDVAYVHVVQKETATVAGRGSYFDSYGIIRDVIQNHLLQILTLLLLDAPSAERHDDVRNQKVKVLHAFRPLLTSDVVLGQYRGYGENDESFRKSAPATGAAASSDLVPSPARSRTATYAAIRCGVSGDKWDGVPIVLEAGKALDERLCEIVVGLKRRPPTTEGLNVGGRGGVGKLEEKKCDGERAELVVRIQPEPGVFLKTFRARKSSSIAATVDEDEATAAASQPPILATTGRYAAEKKELPTETVAFVATAVSEGANQGRQGFFAGRDSSPSSSSPVDDAYASLLLDVVNGRSQSFVREDELLLSWSIFTPFLSALECGESAEGGKGKGGEFRPTDYEVGGAGPPGARETVDRWLGKGYDKDEEEEVEVESIDIEAEGRQILKSRL